MDRRDRNTLKSYFRKGDVPTEQQFAEWIDSVPNIEEDGQVVRTEDGWAFYSHKLGKMRITLHEAEGKPAAWTLALTLDKGLAIENKAGEALLELTQDKRIVLHATVQKSDPDPDPQDYREIKTNKEWTDLVEITDLEETSYVYAISALYRDKDLSVCKLTCATAICLNSIEQWVTSPRKHWWGWSGGVRLRWLEKGGKTCLQICSTKRSYTGMIYCRVTQAFKK